jgi:hypothetical protein
MSAQRRDSISFGVKSQPLIIVVVILMITNSIGQRDDEQDGHVGMSSQLLA